MIGAVERALVVAKVALQLMKFYELLKHSPNLSTVEDVLSLYSSICDFLPYSLSHLMFIEVDQGTINVSVSGFNSHFD